jgi:demethylmenaquinone methyltransferase/2-methoxy-6-polyprenyl-1,4-benzoquinol methylase
MLSWVYMKVLESRPRRYDRGISIMSMGRAGRIRSRMVDRAVREGDRVLDAGTGTGEVALLSARRGARVTGMDVNAGMLEQARRKVREEELEGRVTLVQAGVTEMDAHFDDGSFDVVTASLLLSELYPDERRYALAEFHRVLVPGGVLAVSDEVKPGGALHRTLHHAARLPLAAVTWAATQTTTHALEGLERQVREAGFRVEEAERPYLSHMVVHATREEA